MDNADTLKVARANILLAISSGLITKEQSEQMFKEAFEQAVQEERDRISAAIQELANIQPIDESAWKPLYDTLAALPPGQSMVLTSAKDST